MGKYVKYSPPGNKVFSLYNIVDSQRKILFVSESHTSFSEAGVNVLYVYTFKDDLIGDISPLMLPSCTAIQLRSLAYVDTNNILKGHHPETRLDVEVISIFAYGLCTDETVQKLASLTFT